MSYDPNQSKSDSDFEDLSTIKMASYLKEVHEEMDSSPVTYDDLFEEKQALNLKVDAFAKENCQLKQRVDELEKEILEVRNQQQMTEKVWKTDGEKLLQAQQEVAQLSKALEKTSKPAQQPNKSLLSRIQQLTQQNDKLHHEYKTIQQEKKFIQSQADSIKTMLQKRQKQIQELNQKIQDLSNDTIPNKMNMLNSFDSVDLVLSRDASLVNDRQETDTENNNHARENGKNESEPWIMRQSQTTTMVGESFSKCHKNQHTFNLESQLSEARIQISQLTEKLVKSEEELKGVTEKLIEKIEVIRKLEEKTEQQKDTHQQQLTFYKSQADNVNALYDIQIHTTISLKQKITELQVQVKKLTEEKTVLDETKREENSHRITRDQQKQNETDRFELQLMIKKLEHQLKDMTDKLMRTQQQFRSLEEQNMSLKTLIDKSCVTENKYSQELGDLKQELGVKQTSIGQLHKQINEMEIKQSQQLKEREHVIKQLKEELQQKYQQLENAQNLSTDITQLKEQLVSETYQTQHLSQQLSTTLETYHQLKKTHILLKDQMKQLQVSHDTLVTKYQRMNQGIDKAQKYYQQYLDKLETEKQHLKQTVKTLKQTHLARTKQLNQQIAGARCEAISLRDVIRLYEKPRSNRDRFEVVKKWFYSNDFNKEDKCVLMNWLQEFFKMYVHSSLCFGDQAITNMDTRQW